jgi:predicted ATP-grasp superfamily ATP-dependent carboligase
MTNKPEVTVCVTCVGGRLIYDIIRAIRDVDDFIVKIVGVDADPQAHGRLLCDVFEVLPMAEYDPEGWLAGFRRICSNHGVNALVPLSEGESRLVSQHRDSLVQNGVRSSVSSWSTVSTMTDKLLMLQRLVDRGVDAGGFESLDSEAEIGGILKRLGYPDRKVVMKPRQGRGSRGVLICDASQAEFKRLLPDRFCGAGSHDALLRAMEDEEGGFEEYIAVPFYGGPVSDVDCISKNGNLLQTAVRLRQLKNPLWPTSTGHKIHMDPRVTEHAKALCAAFEIDGAGDFDIVIDDEGKAKLLDAGARFSGSVGGSYTAGANFPAQLLRSMMDLPLMPFHIEDGYVLRPYITMAQIPNANEHDLL